VEDLNRRFAVSPADSRDAHRPLAAGETLAGIFCWEEKRCVQNDFTLRHDNRWYQIRRENRVLPRPKSRVTVRTLLDGTVELWFKNRRLDAVPIEGRPEKPKVAATPKRIPVYHPPPNHPWRKPWNAKNAAQWRKQQEQT
jgi:hypothetical protein